MDELINPLGECPLISFDLNTVNVCTMNMKLERGTVHITEAADEPCGRVD